MSTLTLAAMLIGGGLAVYYSQQKLLNSFPDQSRTAGSGTDSNNTPINTLLPATEFNPIYVGPIIPTDIHRDPTTGVISDRNHPDIIIIPGNGGRTGSQM